MKTCEELQRLLTPYLLGDLDADTANTVKGHIESCLVCQAEVRALEPTLALLSEALTTPAVATQRLSASRRSRIMKFKRGLPVINWMSEKHPKLAVAASVMFLLGLTWGAIHSLRRATLSAEGRRVGSNGRQIHLGIFDENLSRDALDMPSLYPKSKAARVRVTVMEPEPLGQLEEIAEAQEFEFGTLSEPINISFAYDNTTAPVVPELSVEVAPPTQELSVQPAEFDSVAMTDSPVLMKGFYASRSPGVSGAASKATTVGYVNGKASGDDVDFEIVDREQTVIIAGALGDSDGDGLSEVRGNDTIQVEARFSEVSGKDLTALGLNYEASSLDTDDDGISDGWESGAHSTTKKRRVPLLGDMPLIDRLLSSGKKVSKAGIEIVGGSEHKAASPAPTRTPAVSSTRPSSDIAVDRAGRVTHVDVGGYRPILAAFDGTAVVPTTRAEKIADFGNAERLKRIASEVDFVHSARGYGDAVVPDSVPFADGKRLAVKESLWKWERTAGDEKNAEVLERVRHEKGVSKDLKPGGGRASGSGAIASASREGVSASVRATWDPDSPQVTMGGGGGGAAVRRDSVEVSRKKVKRPVGATRRAVLNAPVSGETIIVGGTDLDYSAPDLAKSTAAYYTSEVEDGDDAGTITGKGEVFFRILPEKPAKPHAMKPLGGDGRVTLGADRVARGLKANKKLFDNRDSALGISVVDADAGLGSDDYFAVDEASIRDGKDSLIEHGRPHDISGVETGGSIDSIDLTDRRARKDYLKSESNGIQFQKGIVSDELLGLPVVTTVAGQVAEEAPVDQPEREDRRKALETLSTAIGTAKQKRQAQELMGEKRVKEDAEKKDLEEEREKESEDTTRFKAFGVNPFVSVADQPFSTFAIDVDTASYTLGRNYLQKGFLPPAESVRTEEYVNFFDYAYKAPTHKTFAIYTDVAPSKFGHGQHLLKIGVKGRRLGREEQRQASLTFLIDTSGSMNQKDRLGLVQKSLKLLVNEMNPNDQVAIVQYDSHARLVLEHTPISNKAAILKAIKDLQCGGSTNLEEGMYRAYALAAGNFIPKGENRVLLLSDGVANLGSGAAEDILDKVSAYRDQGITCSVFGFGMGTYDDTMLETLANKGDGTYAFIDSQEEAQRVFVDDLSATLNTIASDVKIQVEYNPKSVSRYRQLGYENRQLKKQDFRNDAIDAGEVGSGQSVTSLYELELGSPSKQEGRYSRPRAANDDVIATVRVRYRRIDTGVVEEIEHHVRERDILPHFGDAPVRFQLSAAVAEFSEILRGSPFAKASTSEDVAAMLRPVSLGLPLDGHVQEFLRLVEGARGMGRGQ